MGSPLVTIAQVRHMMMQYVALPLSLLMSAFTIVTAQNSISTCDINSSCIPIKSCEPIISQLSLAKETSDLDKKRKIIREVREKVCGDRRDRLICCPGTDPDVTGNLQPVMLGSFKNYYHNIGGNAYALDSKTILIKDFTYDGEGPDAFFLAGTSGKPSRLSGDVVLPYPFDGSEDVVLNLPSGVSVQDLRWLSVWCRDYQIDFGHLTFPHNLVL